MEKQQLRQKFLTLLEQRLSKPNNQKEMQATLEELAGILSKSFVTKVEPEVRVTNQEDASKALIKYLGENGLKIQKPDWYKQPKINIPPRIKADLDSSVIVAIGSILSTFLGELLRGIGNIAQGPFVMRHVPEHYITPQQVVLINPRTGQPMTPEDMGSGVINVAPALAASGGPTSVGIRGTNQISDGQATVTTAGTRVQLPDTPCSRVMIQAHPANGTLGSEGATVVIGGNGVIADATTRRGLALFSTQWQEFRVDKLSRLWIDATENGAKINYIYEV